MNKLLIEAIEMLKKRNESISFAESCTGGRIVAAFTAIAGVSSVLNGSCVTYSNEIKHKWLDVTTKTLEKFGAVSSECVHEMLTGIQKKSNSDYAIAVSGIAGPDGGTEEKAVGTVYIGILCPDKTIVKRYHFKGDREAVQSAATKVAIMLLRENL
ncbi:MAG: CinA family protein [Sulfurovum sp.]|nr:CinA family protein [Sulfurovum sp.]